MRGRLAEAVQGHAAQTSSWLWIASPQKACPGEGAQRTMTNFSDGRIIIYRRCYALAAASLTSERSEYFATLMSIFKKFRSF